MVMLPYLAWGAELAGGYHDRSRVTGTREGFVVVGTLIAAGIPALFADDMRTAMQVLGGISITWEHASHLRLRRTLLNRRLFGDESAQYAAIADMRLADRELS